MSNAKERAKERYSIVRGDDTQETSGIDMQRASDFIDGYEQAIEDIYKWLQENAYKYSVVGLYTDAMITDLKQAMKDERV